jgi:hypothetical protein
MDIYSIQEKEKQKALEAEAEEAMTIFGTRFSICINISDACHYASWYFREYKCR